jgi:hypothetical protein
MALAFPLSLPNLVDLLQIESVTWNLMHFQEYSGLGSGEGLTADLAPPLWEGDVATAAFYHRDVEKWRARFNTLDGATNSFMLYNPAARFPESDPQGSLLAGLNITVLTIGANRKELSLAGLPAGFVAPWGAYAQITGGNPSRVALVQFAESKTATVSGNTSAIECRPHLRPWIAAGMAVTLINPAAKVKLVPNSLRVETVGALMSRLRFTARQTLAAG